MTFPHSLRLFTLPLLTFIATVSAAVTLVAQTAQVGAITGKVFNPTTTEFVNRAEVRIEGTRFVAYTESDGSFRLDGVPVGDHVLVVIYTGYQEARRNVNVNSGLTPGQDVEIQPRTYGRAAETVQLSAFTVSAEREGNAKAIMEQRAAINAKNVVSSDTYGEGTDGNVGEFIKFIPGIVIDYGSPAARGAMIGGLDSVYTGMSVDGVEIGTGASANFGSRAVELDALSLANVESVEVNKTLTADMDANAPAGLINMRSKNAFDRKGRVLAYQFALTANSHAMSLDKTPGPREETSRKIRPSWRIDYSDVYLGGRLGVQLTLSDLTRNTPREFQATSYNYGTPSRGPFITQIGFSSNSVLARTTAAGLNLDFKATPALVLSLRSSYSSRLAPSTNRTWNLTASAGDVLPESTLLRVVTRANGANTRLQEGAALNNNKYTVTLTASPRFKYTRGAMTVAGGVDYSVATAEYKDVSDGFFSIATSRLSSMSWAAERSGRDATDWKVTQLTGRPWSDPASYNLDSAVANNIGSRQRRGENIATTGRVDVTRQFSGEVPIMLKVGAKAKVVGYKIVSGGPQNWTYVGTGTSQTVAGAALPTETIFRYGYDGNLNDATVVHNWPYPDRTRLHQLLVSNPEYFRPNTVDNFQQQFFFPQSVKEEIDSAYAAANGRWKGLRFEGGLRYELTRTKAKILEAIPAASIRAARPDLVAGTIPYILYQYHDGVRDSRYGRYENLFWNGSVKYAVKRNLNTQLSFSDAVLRPSYNNLAGRETVDETNRTVTIPNSALKPETSRKYYGGVQYYFEPAGTLSAGMFVLEVKDILESRRTLTQEQAGYADQPEYNGYTFLAFRNGSGTVRNRGFDFEYSQQLVFLPGVLNGLSAFASMTRVIGDEARVNVVNKAASGGIAYRLKRFTARANANWQSPKIRSISAAVMSFQAERTVIDIDASYRFSDRCTLFVSGKNVTDAPSIIYEVNGVYGHKLETQVAAYGVSWTFGVKGTF